MEDIADLEAQVSKLDNEIDRSNLSRNALQTLYAKCIARFDNSRALISDCKDELFSCTDQLLNKRVKKMFANMQTLSDQLDVLAVVFAKHKKTNK